MAFVAAYKPATLPAPDSSPMTCSVTVAAGDTLVVLAGTGASTSTLTPSGGGLTYTLQQQSAVTSAFCNAYCWTALNVASAQTFTLSVAFNAVTSNYGTLVALRFSGISSIGAGTANTGSTGAPSLTFTTTGTNSAICFGSGDFNGVNGTSRTYITSAGVVTDDNYDNNAAYGMSDYQAHYANVGAAGSKTVGLSAPTGQKWSAVAVELVGSSGTSYTQSPADNEPLTDIPTVVQARQQVIADTQALTDTVTPSLGHFGSGADNAGLTDTATAVREYRVSDTEGLTDSVIVVQNQRLTIADAEGLSDTGGGGSDPNLSPIIGRLPDGSVFAVLVRPDIINYQFMFDTTPWCPFGEGQAVNLSKFTPSGSAVRNQDVPGGLQDVLYFGTDLHTPGSWSWDLFTDVGSDPGSALGWVDTLARLWNAKTTRATPGPVLALRYSVAGRVRRVYGRPRRWTPIHDTLHYGKVKITADFQLAEDEVYYDDAVQTVTVGFTASVITGTYLTFPIIFPTAMQAPGKLLTQQMIIGGTQDTWITPTFSGAVSNPWVQVENAFVGQLRWSLNGPVTQGGSVTLSGQPWALGVTDQAGASRADMLDPRSRLSQLRLPPGQYTVSFGGLSTTSSATCTVAWRNAYRSL